MDIVVSVFRLTNDRYRMVPKLDFQYMEAQTGIRWQLSAGGSRAYTIRFGKGIGSPDPESIDTQNADSHFMLNRVQYALLMSGHGLFHAQAVGRTFLRDVQEKPDWTVQLDLPTTKAPNADKVFYDWLKALCDHTVLRRAAADAHAALLHQHEAGTYVYRGLEWLVVGEGRSWEDLGPDLGVSKDQMRDFKKLVNVDHGVRHASRSGAKLRANNEQAARLVCALFDAINATRSRLEPGYKAAAPEVVAEAVAAAMPTEPYS